MPVAATEKVAVCPAVTVLLRGCVVIDGATGAAVTVSVAALLVTLPEVSVTATVKDEPLSEVAVTGVVYEDPVAPLIAIPFFFH